jgi:hypothetical protein
LEWGGDVEHKRWYEEGKMSNGGRGESTLFIKNIGIGKRNIHLGWPETACYILMLVILRQNKLSSALHQN